MKRMAWVLVPVAAFVSACSGGKPASDAPAGQAAVSTGIGVAECDSYLEKYLACIESKTPAGAQAVLRQQLEQARAAWKQAAATPEGRAGLASACAQAKAASKQAMSTYGCAW